MKFMALAVSKSVQKLIWNCQTLFGESIQRLGLLSYQNYNVSLCHISNDRVNVNES